MTEPSGMDHKEFLASLSADERAKLTEKSDLHGLTHLAGHWGAIAIVGTLIHAEVPLWPLLLPVQGILIVFTFTLLHECTHNTPFASQWLNIWVGRICGVMVFLPFEWFRYFHFAHHKFTNDPENDPELLSGAKPNTVPDYLKYVIGLPTWKSHIATLLRNAKGGCNDSFVPPKKLNLVRKESSLMLILYGLIGFTSYISPVNILTLWIWPIILGQPFLRLYLLAEHGRCPHVNDMLKNSRTTLTFAPVRFLASNMPYHAEHHTFPAVPFSKLPLLHSKIRAHLSVMENGYLRFHQGYIQTIGQKEQ